MPNDMTLTDEMKTWLNSRLQPQADWQMAADLHTEFELEDTKDGWEQAEVLVKQWRESA